MALCLDFYFGIQCIVYSFWILQFLIFLLLFIWMKSMLSYNLISDLIALQNAIFNHYLNLFEKLF